MADKCTWKVLMAQHDKLAKYGAGVLYDRIKLLHKVSEDPHFVEAMRAEGKDPSRELTKKVNDTCCANINELFHMLKLFPKKKTWEQHDLAALREKMLKQFSKSPRPSRAGKNEGKQVPKRRTTATLSEVREKDGELARLRDQLKSANQIIKSLESQLETARETIGSLNEAIALFKLDKQPKKAAAKI